jgi:hypothetical protein
MAGLCNYHRHRDDKLSAMILFPEFIKDEVLIRKIADECISRRIPVISMEKKLDGCVCFSFDRKRQPFPALP